MAPGRRFGWSLRADRILLVGLVAWTGLAVVLQIRLAAQLGGPFTGIQNLYPPDQLQYLAWIRDAGTHGLIGDHFQLLGSPHYDFLQPMFLLSGVLWRLGVSLPVAYLIWAPVAVVLTWAGFRALIRRHLSGWSATAALALGLFYMSPLAAWAFRTFTPMQGVQDFGREVSVAVALWGYFPRAIAVALLPVLVLCLEGIVEPSRRAPGRRARFYVVAATAAAGVAAWLHPWQGVVALLIVVGIAAWSRPPRRQLLLLSLPAAGAALPLLYYEALLHLDRYWRLGDAQSALPSYGVLALAATFLPLVLLAAFGARRSFARGTHRRTLLLWLGAATVGYLATATFPLHFFDGITLPLSILAVEGWQRLRFSKFSRGAGATGMGRIRFRTFVAAAAIAIWTLPGLYYFANMFHVSQHHTEWAPSFTASDSRALTYLERSRVPGGVFASPYIAAAVPAFTGRSTWEGHFAWSPDDRAAETLAWRLIAGAFSRRDVERIVEATGARFLLIDCHTRTDLPAAVGSDVIAQHGFGCAAVYELRRSIPNPQALEAAERAYG